MAKKCNHYHVFSGLTGGYLPNLNEVHTSKRSAQSSASWLADQSRFDDIEVSGSAKAGWYDIGEHEYIEVTACQESDCESSEYD